MIKFCYRFPNTKPRKVLAVRDYEVAPQKIELHGLIAKDHFCYRELRGDRHHVDVIDNCQTDFYPLAQAENLCRIRRHIKAQRRKTINLSRRSK